jgi:hypothetical protein
MIREDHWSPEARIFEDLQIFEDPRPEVWTPQIFKDLIGGQRLPILRSLRIGASDLCTPLQKLGA